MLWEIHPWEFRISRESASARFHRMNKTKLNRMDLSVSIENFTQAGRVLTVLAGAAFHEKTSG